MIVVPASREGRVMRCKRLAIQFLAAAGLALAATTGANACACCAESGQRFESFAAFDGPGFESQTVTQLMPDGAATLYRDAAEWDEVIRGLKNPDKSASYKISLKRSAKSWAFALEDAKGNTGSITLALPREFEVFATDTRPGEIKPGERVELYKEIRVTGVMRGTGMFKVAETGTRRVTVVFHGHGNGCTLPDGFHHWTLTASGPGARYSFFGKLKPPN